MFGHKKFDKDVITGRVLDLGCGSNKLAGSTGLDCRELPGVDIIADLNERLPIKDNEYDIIYANQVLEHVRDLLPLMEEIHRILKPGGKLVAHVPHFRSAWAHIDPTHCRCFTINTMDVFVHDTYIRGLTPYTERAFVGLEVFLDTDYRSYPWRVLFTRLALFRPWRFENSILSCLYPFAQITYVLTK